MLLPGETPVKHRDFRVRRVARTTSTQDLVRRAAARGAPDGYCVVAAEQVAGRGRQGRSWEAPPGSALLASVLLRLPAHDLPGVPFAAGLAVVDVLGTETGIAARLKWPNDVLVDGGKIAGLLVEVAGSDSDGHRAVVVGLGLNRTVDTFPAGATGMSLHRLIPHPPPLDRLLRAWLSALDARIDQLQQAGMAALLTAWRDRAIGIGTQVTATGASGSLSGVAAGIDDQGSLLIRSSTGAVHRMLAGDVHLAPPEPDAPAQDATDARTERTRQPRTARGRGAN